jgi:hypothetical protein
MDISFYCYKCGQSIVIDEAGAGLTVSCPKCGQSLSVPQAQPPPPKPPTPSTDIPPLYVVIAWAKRRIGKVLGIAGLLFVFLAILFIKTHPKPAAQLQRIIQRFAALSSGSADVDSLEFDVRPSPSGSLVSPYVGTVDYVVPAQVGFPTMPASEQTYKDCHVHVRALFAYQDAEWVFKELQPDQEDVDRAGWKYTQTRRDPQLHGRYTFILSPESLERLEQHRQRWQTATARE